MWKELGSQNFKTVGLHQPLNHITRVNTQVGSMCSETGTSLIYFVQIKQLEQCLPTTNFQPSSLPFHLKLVNV